MTDKLKPCPFCGGEAKVFKDTLVYTSVPNGAQYIVWCTKCGCRSPMNIENKEEAIKAWNTRPNHWHTGKPTEEGWYLLECNIGNSDETYYVTDHWNNEVGYWTVNKVIRWQKIEPYEASKERE